MPTTFANKWSSILCDRRNDKNIRVTTQQAIRIPTTSNLVEAMDLSKEDLNAQEHYGENDKRFRANGAAKMTENFLIARRLVETGVRGGSKNFSRWDCTETTSSVLGRICRCWKTRCFLW